MKNYIQPGKYIEVSAPAAVASGDGVLVGDLFGVAVKDADSAEQVNIAVEGVYSIKALSTDTLSVGDLCYWDNTAKEVVATGPADALIGVASKQKLNGDLVAEVRLNGSFA